MKHAVGVFFLASSLCFGATNADNAPPLRSGIDLQYVDSVVRPQDDASRYLSGKWLAGDVIPADRASYGSFDALADMTELQLKAIVEELSAAKDLAAGSDERKVADLFRAFMDEDLTERSSMSALTTELERIAALTDKRQLPVEFARLQALGVSLPIEFDVDLDARDSTHYAAYVGQGGLSLPDRDYYLKDDAKLRQVREAYQVHVARMLALAGNADAKALAARIVTLETALAKVQWTNVQNRDPVKTYNKIERSRFRGLIRGFDWRGYFTLLGVDTRLPFVVAQQPSYFHGLGKILAAESLDTWRAYLQWHLLNSYARYLGRAYVDADFDFYGRTVRGIPQDRPRWKRGVSLVNGAVGEALGRIYVERHFPAQSKARMQALVANLIQAYRQSISTLDWMGDRTKAQALAKLDKLTLKIGYPERWRDYGKLRIEANDPVGNVVRARSFEFARRLGRLGKPIDRGEWEMAPQTVNAYYRPDMNEIVFPAAILQPPFFDAAADDAVNYGGIGAVIGHEISHGFDDQGSHFDAEGNLRDWWTPADHAKFAAKGKALVAQYSAFEPVPGFPVNGELTLGENIADTSGLAIAYKAYHLGLADHEAPLIDGLTGDQRFCLGWAQVWRDKMRDAETIRLVKSNPHSPAQFRANGTLSNIDAFYSAFAVKEGDKMYRSPDQRVHIW